MQNKRRDFSKSKLRKETAGLVLGEGLLLSEGDKHARNRKVLCFSGVPCCCAAKTGGGRTGCSRCAVCCHIREIHETDVAQQPNSSQVCVGLNFDGRLQVLRPSFEGTSLAKFIDVMESCCSGVEKSISLSLNSAPEGGAVEVDMSELVQEATLLMVTQCLFSTSSSGDGKRLKKWIGDAFR